MSMNSMNLARLPPSRSSVQFAVRSDSPGGGALKLRHYFEHVLASELAEHSFVYMPEDTKWGDSNPWSRYRARVSHSINWASVAIAVISGWGWDRFIPKRFQEAPPFRVVYLVQSFDRIDPEDSQFRHLANPAIRICVSAPLEDALRRANVANGPIHTIPACIESPRLSAMDARDLDVLIVGYKRPDIAGSVARQLNSSGVRAELLMERLGREGFLQMLARARTVVCLPARVEGFYLPALEAMAIGALTVCPDVRGNDYCLDGFNCLKPAYRVEALVGAAKEAATMPAARIAAIREGARVTVAGHDLSHERSKFQTLLREILRGEGGRGGGRIDGPAH